MQNTHGLKTQDALAEKMGKNRTTVGRYLNGTVRPELTDLQAFALAIGEEVPDALIQGFLKSRPQGAPNVDVELWAPQLRLLHGSLKPSVTYPAAADDDLRPELTQRTVRVVGYVGAGAVATLYATAQGPFDEVEPPVGASDDTVAVEVRGVSLGPAFDNALVFYDDDRNPVTPDQHGRLCVVGLRDGRVLVKIVRAAADGRFHLLSNTAEEPLLDQEVAWAARVTDIRPR